MIISQTPLRVSFLGGGTDLAEYYHHFGGAVLSTAIDKYIYVIVKSRYDDHLVLNYSEKEIVKNPAQIKHRIIREALQLSGIESAVEITCVADIPSSGSGLGSSSSFTVGLLNALFAYKGQYLNQRELAEMACHIEIEKLQEPIGKQDQYAAAFGGIRSYEFKPDGYVDIRNIPVDLRTRQDLNMLSLLFFTGQVRKAAAILNDQKKNTPRNLETLHRLKKLAATGEQCLSCGDFKELGRLLDENWELKKNLSRHINNPVIDTMYRLGINNGAWGGKLLGAGGGGFLFFLCPLEKQAGLRAALRQYHELPFQYDPYGSRIIFNIKDHNGLMINITPERIDS